MKKFSFFIFLIALLTFSACNSDTSNNKSHVDVYSSTISSTSKLYSKPTIAPKENTESTTVPQVTKENDDAQGGAIIELRKYRVCYYNIPAPFADLVGRDISHEWEIEYGKTHNVHLSNRMLIVDFINSFNISKEDFERANLELAKSFYENNHNPSRNPKDYANQEIYEVYNADIIYTFDDEIINEYYLSHEYPYLYDVEFEEAVANGEYTSQTEEWVDVEAMEAEIIAKYGEAEIVTDITEQTASETTAEITTTVETIIPETEIQITE